MFQRFKFSVLWYNRSMKYPELEKLVDIIAVLGVKTVVLGTESKLINH